MPFEVLLNRHHIKVLLLTALASMLAFFTFTAATALSETLFFVFFLDFHTRIAHTLYHFGSYIAMLFGGIIMGYIGDQWGRKTSLIFALFGLSLFTLALALMPDLPDYGRILAILILCSKIGQGCFFGGILPSIWTLISEHLPSKRIGFGSGVVMASGLLGILLFYFMNNILNNTLTYAQMFEIGWRLILGIGGAFGVILLFITRKYLKETVIFLRQKVSLGHTEQAVKNDTPGADRIFYSLHSAWYDWLLTLRNSLSVSMLIAVILSVLIVGLLNFMPFLLVPLLELNFTTTLLSSRFGSMLTIFFMALGSVVFGSMADYICSTRLLTVSGISLLLLSAIFVLYVQDSSEFILLFLMLSGFLAGIIGAAPVVLMRLFTHSIRLSGIAISFNLTFALLGGILPFLLGFLSYYAGSIPMLYLMFMGLLTVFVGFYTQHLSVMDDN